MKKFLLLLMLAILPTCMDAEKRVSKIVWSYDVNDTDFETQLFTYDESGRLSNWKEYDGDDVNGTPDFDVTITYVDSRLVNLSGYFDSSDLQNIDVRLNDDGLAESFVFDDYHFNFGYSNKALSEITASDGGYGYNVFFQFSNGNPVEIINDDRYSTPATITYSERPNKCGMVYLPMILNECLWRYRVTAYAGLLGYGSKNLAYSCDLSNYGDGIIDYEIDNDGYIKSMYVTKASDGDGFYTYEYCEVNAVDDIRPDLPEIKVIAKDGRIAIEGQYETADVYDLCGARHGLSDLIPGVYIVDIDGRRFKTVVK